MIDTTPSGFYSEFSDDAQSCVDDIDLTNLIAFTWSPDPSKYPSSEPRKQYKSLLSHILLSAFKFFRLFCFIPEINTNGNVHIHGWFIVKDKIAYYKYFLPRCRQYGYVVLKSKVDKQWFNYCNKEIGDSIEIIGEDMPIPLTHLNSHNYKNLFNKKKTIKYVQRPGFDVWKMIENYNNNK